MARVLVVDDEKSIRITLREFLQNEGYDVQIAGDAIEALRILKTEEFDVVLSDLIMPKLTGVELLAQIQMNSSNVKVIIMTGEPTADTAAKALRNGAFDYLVKPINKESVLKVVASAFGLKSLEDENRRYREGLEQLVEDRTRELKQSGEKYQSIVENIGLGIALISPEMEILELNNQVREWFPNIDPGEKPICYRAFNDPPREIFCDDCPADRTRLDGQVHESITIYPTAGGNRQYRISSSPIMNEKGEIKAVIVIMEDMTVRLTLEAQLRQAQKLEAMGTLASGIAHDINNTLAPITLYTDALLESEENLSERARRFLTTIKQAAGDIESTIGRLSTFYKKDGGGLLIKPVDLHDLFQQVIDMTRPRWKDLLQKSGKTIEMKIDIPEHSPVFSGIESEIREALVNLVLNAVDAMPGGGIVTLRAVENEENVILEIEDTGTGMNDEQKSKCLEPFFTTKGDSGSGLGLAMVFGTMRRHHGEIEIDSEEGRGTTIRLIFPQLKSGNGAQATELVPNNLPPLRILCIDDEPAVREALKEILEMDNHQVVVAGNGMEGVKAVEETTRELNDFDVIITDLGMPDMDGWEVAERIKKLRPDTPVFLLSGWGNFIDDSKKEVQLVDGIMGKPPQIAEIRKALQKVFSPISEDLLK
ncbi:MAG: response regulator [Spirochaetales bacterium]|nr:response regulator [Spirochaetales bacterium]